MSSLIHSVGLFLFLVSLSSHAETCSTPPTSNVGCEFYAVTLPNPNLDQSTFDFAIDVMNANDSAVDVTVTGGNLMVPEMRALAVGGAVRITLPWVATLSDTTATLIAPGKAYQIISTGPVVVVQFNSAEPGSDPNFSSSNDGSLLFPVSLADTAFQVLTWPTLNLGGFQYPGNVAVVATEDNTTVQVVAPSTIQPGGGLSASGGSVEIDRGDVLLVASALNAPLDGVGADLSGATITSSQPVLAWDGHSLARVPTDVSFADHLEESLPSRALWSSKHVVVRPGAPNGMPSSARHVVRLTAGSSISLVSDPAVAGLPTIMNSGEVAEFETNVDFSLTSTGPILVASYMEGSEVFGGQGDPAMSFVVPVALAQREMSFLAPLAMGKVEDTHRLQHT